MEDMDITVQYNLYAHNLTTTIHVHALTVSAACTLMCSKVITAALCQLAKEKIVVFSKLFQLLFGDVACVPNMHFACHIPDSLLRFGPAAGF